MYCKVFRIDGLNLLKSIKIGKYSFSKVVLDKKRDPSRSFHILNCEHLQSIEIGEFSFADYSGTFDLKNLRSLSVITIGQPGTWSSNFYYASFIVKGNGFRYSL